MEQVEAFLLFTERLEQTRVVYMVTGSVASMLYGVPRFTHDVDIVVELPNRQIGALANDFPTSEFYCPPADVLLVECSRTHRGHFNLIHHETGFKADVYIHGEDALQSWGLGRRTRIELAQDRGLWVAPPEYVIVRKLEYYREGRSEKHLTDIRGMMEVSGDIVDRGELDRWIQDRSLDCEWQRVVREP